MTQTVKVEKTFRGGETELDRFVTVHNMRNESCCCCCCWRCWRCCTLHADFTVAAAAALGGDTAAAAAAMAQNEPDSVSDVTPQKLRDYLFIVFVSVFFSAVISTKEKPSTPFTN